MQPPYPLGDCMMESYDGSSVGWEVYATLYMYEVRSRGGDVVWRTMNGCRGDAGGLGEEICEKWWFAMRGEWESCKYRTDSPNWEK